MSEQKLSTIQKRNNLNAVYRDGEEGPGGAYHEYDVYRADDDPENGNPLIVIQFQKGPRNDPEAPYPQCVILGVFFAKLNIIF